MSTTFWKHGKFFNGTKGDDVLNGTDRSDALFGNRGADVLHGGGGRDFLDGGAGDDSLDGGKGNDLLKGGRGNDTLDGGDGVDVALFSGRLSDYRIERADGGAVRITDLRAGKDGSDLLVNIEKVAFADGSYKLADLLPQGVVLTGTDADEILTGTAYDDQIAGGFGNDTLIGGGGNDLLTGDGVFTDVYADEFNGGAGNDTLVGSSDDIFDGGDGFDTVRMPDSNGPFVASDANFRDVEAVELGRFSARVIQRTAPAGG